MAEIRWTKEAQWWLREIHDYIAADYPQTAQRVTENIVKRVEVLKRLPHVGHRYLRYPEHHIRILLYGHYRIAYLIQPDDSIDILGIFHGTLDIDKHLFWGKDG